MDNDNKNRSSQDNESREINIDDDIFDDNEEYSSDSSSRDNFRIDDDIDDFLIDNDTNNETDRAENTFDDDIDDINDLIFDNDNGDSEIDNNESHDQSSLIQENDIDYDEFFHEDINDDPLDDPLEYQEENGDISSSQDITDDSDFLNFSQEEFDEPKIDDVEGIDTRQDPDVDILFAILKEENNKSLVEENDEEKIQEQILTNKQLGNDPTKLPNNIGLIDSPIEITPDMYPSDPEDEKDNRRLLSLAASIIAIIASAAILIPLIMGGNEQPQTTARGNDVGNGSLIDNSLNVSGNNNQESQNNSNPDEEIDVPSGGKEVLYELISEDDSFTGISATWVKEGKTTESASNISSPWRRSVGIEKDSTPILRANTTGFGTITCRIVIDGQTVSEDTVSGEDPQVGCQEEQSRSGSSSTSESSN